MSYVVPNSTTNAISNRSEVSASSDIDSIFNVDFANFRLADNDDVASELHREWSFFISQLNESIFVGNEIMSQLKSKEDIQSIEKMINIFTKQNQKIEFIIYRFRTAQTSMACNDVDSCEL